MGAATNSAQVPGQFALPPTVPMRDRLLRPILLNPDGGYSTERTITVNDPNLNGGAYTVIPTIINGQVVTPREAVAHAIKTGEHYGAFDSIPASEANIAVTHAILSRMTAPAAKSAWEEALGTSPRRTEMLRRELQRGGKR